MKTAGKQRWTIGRILRSLGLLIAIGFMAWFFGMLPVVLDKVSFLLLMLAATFAVFLIELLPQLFIATYEAGRGVTGNTEELKGLYESGKLKLKKMRGGSDASQDFAEWDAAVSEQLKAHLPHEQFGFDTCTDQMERLFTGIASAHQRMDTKLKKLRSILMRADAAPED